jgi:hypothetical protein
MRTFATARGAMDAARIAEEVQLRSERKAGAFLEGMEKHVGGRPTKTGDIVSPVSEPKLSDLGVTKKQSSRWQAMARIPEPDFERPTPTMRGLKGTM